MIKKIASIAFTALVPFLSFSQEIKIKTIKMIDNEVEVHYNLIDERIDRSYAISLFTSKDNFIQPMDMVTGDIGIDISVGDNKVVKWRAKEELGDTFDGALSLELKGNYYVPFIVIDGFYEGKQFKRGKTNDFVWSGGRGDNILNFELYRGKDLIKSYDERPNIGNTSIIIPNRARPSDDYRFKISDTRNRDEVVFTEPFMVKRKIPLGAQFGIAVGVGVGIGYLLKAILDNRDQEEPDIPLPILPE